MRRLAGLFEEVLAGAALLVVVAAVGWGVVTRYVTVQPSAWAAEVAGIAFSWLVFLGSAAGFKIGAHVSIDLLVRRIPRRLRRWSTALADACVLGFLLALSVLALEFCIDAWSDPTPVLRLPRTLFYAPVFLGAVCMFVRYLPVVAARWREAGPTAQRGTVPPGLH